MDQPHRHASHPAIANRLKRAQGHLRSIVAMIEEERPCVDIAQQLFAVERAVRQAKVALIRDHLDHCLGDASGQPGLTDAADEFRRLARYL